MIKNWLIHGDCHGSFYWVHEIKTFNPEETAFIILGDVGFNYYLNNRDDRLKREINAIGYRFYCVRGNHEARPQDVSAPIDLVYDDEVGGYIYMEEQYPNIRYFKDWGEYTINHYHIAVIGGAYSVDKWWRLARVDVQNKLDLEYNNPKKTGWFPNEQLSAEEMAQAEEELKDKTFDFVFSHTCPYDWRPTDLFLSSVDQSTIDSSMELWMNELKDKIDWNIWLFGHYHADRLERPHVEIYYNDIEVLDDIYDRWSKYDATGEVDWWLQKSPNFYMI